MPLIFPAPFPKQVQPVDPKEVGSFGLKTWQRLQKFRAGQFVWPASASPIPGATVRTVTFTDVSVAGTDTGVDNLVVGMWVTLAPPTGINPALEVDYGYCTAPGVLVAQVRNPTAGSIALAGIWTYVGYTF